jgi:glycoside/pentoside/hexuronide:cation symporter, GPH family
MSTPEPERLSFREKFAYGLGDTASNFYFQTFNLFLLYYYTDVFGISAAVVGTMFIFTRILDCVTDPLMGMMADRTKTRWGKYRPYLLWMVLPYGVFGWAMFANPDLSPTGKVVYAYVTYSAVMLAYTAINIPYSALMGVISPSSKERTSVATYRFVCAFAGGLLVASLFRPLKNALGGGDEIAGIQWTMAIFAAVSMTLFLITFAGTRERVVSNDGAGATMRKDLGFLLRNRAWVVMFFAGIFTLTNVAVRNAVTVFYFKYYVGDDGGRVFLFWDQTSLFMTSGMLAMIAGVACTKWFTNRWGKKELLITLSALNAVSMFALFFLRPDQVAWMFVINIAGTFLNGPTPAIVWAMYADTADYGEWKFHRRTTALLFSSAQFGQKLGIAVGGAIAGWTLGLFGFVPNTAQAPETLLGIKILFAIVPVGFAVLNIIALCFYPISEAQVKQIESDLAARRTASTPPTPVTV